MTGGIVRRVASATVAVALGCGTVSGCSAESPGAVAEGPWVEPDELAYCSHTGGGDDDFWELVHASCRIAGDGDLVQAEALRQALEELPDDAVAEFHRTFVRVNEDLRVAGDVADAICAPGLGLGDDLGTDYRSWIVAHGQAAYEAVAADPEVLRSFPDASAGCGLGEPFGYAAYTLYLESTGLSPREAGLPSLESAR